MATIAKRDSGEWQAKVRIKGHPPKSKMFKYRDDAVEWAKDIEVAIQRNIYFDHSIAEKTTISELFDKFKEEILPSKKGKHYKPALKVLEGHFGKFSLAVINSKMVAEYRDIRLQTVGASSVNKEIKLFASIIDIAGKEWGIQLNSNPCRFVSLPAEPRGRNRRLEGDEYKRLLKACGTESKEAAAIFVFAVETGARLGEILSLKWSEVDFSRSIAELNDGKTGDRVIPLSPAAVKAIKSLPRTPDRVFPTWIASDSFNKVWRRICKAAEVSNLHFHDLRHEGVSRLFERGFNVVEVASVSGHKTLSMLNRYTHMRAADIAAKLASPKKKSPSAT